MLSNLVRNPLLVILWFIVFAISISFHEFSHAYSAYLLGDPTAKNQGRLTLNPLKHLDPLGTLMIFLIQFGWAKPTPVNAINFENRKQGVMLTSLAGPVSNLLLAFVFAFPYVYFLKSGYFIVEGFYLNIGSVNDFMYNFVRIGFKMNILLAIFNMLPVPPLDGSKILSGILPSRQYYKMLEYETYIMIGFVILMFTGILGSIINPITGIIEMAMKGVVSPIIGFFI